MHSLVDTAHHGVQEKPSRPGVLERATLIMDLFASGQQFVMLEEVADRTGLPRSTAFRMLRQLVDLGWLRHDARGYQIGVRAQMLQARVGDHSELREAASAVLNEVNLRTGAVCHLGVLEGSAVHYLDKVGGAAAASVPSRVGARLGAATTVTGRALLASLCPEDVDQLIGVRVAGEECGPDPLARLHHELTLIRRGRGVAFSYGERCSMGITSVAAPVEGPHGVVAAISIAVRKIMPLERMGPAVLAAARRTSERLYPEWVSSRPTPRRVAAAI